MGSKVRVESLAVGPEGRLWLGVTDGEPGPPNVGAVLRTAEPVVVGVERPEVPRDEPVKPGVGEAVLAVWPNPVEAEAMVELTLTAPLAVRVGVYDVLGREIAVLHEGDLTAGNHRFPFEAEGLPVGVYFVRAEVVTGGRIVTKAQAFSLAR